MARAPKDRYSKTVRPLCRRLIAATVIRPILRTAQLPLTSAMAGWLSLSLDSKNNELLNANKSAVRICPLTRSAG